MWDIAYIWVSSTMASDTRYTREFKSRIAMARAVFSKQTVCISRLKLDIRKKLVKHYIWSLAL